MSKQIDFTQPLSGDDRAYLMDRGRYAEIEANDAEFGERKPPEDDDTLEDQIYDLEEQLAVLRTRMAHRDLAREQGVVGVKDNTVVDGEGGEEPEEDNYDDLSVAKLKEEIGKRNSGRDPEDRISMAGTKAELVERLRADDAEDDEDDEDE